MEEKKSPIDQLQLDSTRLNKMFLQPLKKVLLTICIFFFLNTLLIYFLTFFIPDTSVAMIATVWVGIIAWKGGISAGLIACLSMFFSNMIAIKAPPHNLPDQFYFNNTIPSFLIGLVQSLFSGLIAGYISTLVHKLRNEILLRKAIQMALEQKVAELDVFSRTVAHDLKNPVSAINISTNLLVKEFAKSDNENVKRKLAIINECTNHMINIIESILILAGIKKVDPKQNKLFSMSECIEEALRRMRHSIEANFIHIEQPDTWPFIFGYAPWITEAWVNYINNAIKYGDDPIKSGRRVITLGFDQPGTYQPEQHNHIRFWIRDYGNGIEKEKIGLLFKEFSRLHSTEYEGHGLGLSIVKMIIEKFGGSVGAESEPGKGSLFYFTLPVSTTDKPEVKPCPDKIIVANEKKRTADLHLKQT